MTVNLTVEHVWSRQIPPSVATLLRRGCGTAMAGSTVFISYRRNDASAQAGRLAMTLTLRFGTQRVFFDTESVAAGESFPDRIQRALDCARVVLVVIGPGWISATDLHYRRRIDDEDDWVRKEVLAALMAPDVTVIPVLVDGAALPPPEALPSAIASLAQRECLPLQHAHFADHARRIADRIKDLGVVVVLEESQHGEDGDAKTCIKELIAVLRSECRWHRGVMLSSWPIWLATTAATLAIDITVGLFAVLGGVPVLGGFFFSHAKVRECEKKIAALEYLRKRSNEPGFTRVIEEALASRL